MLSHKKIRLLGVSILSILLIFLLFRANKQAIRTEELNTSGDKSQVIMTANNIIDTQNDEKVNEAINKELSKLNKEEKEAKIADDERDDDLSKSKDSSTFDPETELREIRAISPMVVFSKSYCPFSKNIKNLLHDHYQITPEPAIVELDKHKHGAELQAYLTEVSGRKTVPNVLVGSSLESRGGSDDFVKLHNEGKLLESLKEWGEKKLDVKLAEPPSNL